MLSASVTRIRPQVKFIKPAEKWKRRLFVMLDQLEADLELFASVLPQTERDFERLDMITQAALERWFLKLYEHTVTITSKLTNTANRKVPESLAHYTAWQIGVLDFDVMQLFRRVLARQRNSIAHTKVITGEMTGLFHQHAQKLIYACSRFILGMRRRLLSSELDDLRRQLDRLDLKIKRGSKRPPKCSLKYAWEQTKNLWGGVFRKYFLTWT